MLILGIETSCDETGLALLDVEIPSVGGQSMQEDVSSDTSGSHRGPLPRHASVPRAQLLGQALHSQADLHSLYGGVVPELASRDHLLRLLPLLENLLHEAGRDLRQIDRIAVTQGPGLAGALLVGSGFAYGLAAALDRPVVPVHHLEGHLLSPLLEAETLDFPFVALLVSGGHTQLLEVVSVGRYKLLGETIDDAAGEAFDKAAQLLGLGYPGGPEIARLAQAGRAGRYALPRPLRGRPTLDMSFAGLKTAVLTHVKKGGGLAGLSAQDRADLAAETQQAIVDVLVTKSIAAVRATGLGNIVVAGGVSANMLLRQQLDTATKEMGVCTHYPSVSLCTDNGVMIAWAAGMRAACGERAAAAGAFAVRPRWPLSERDLAPDVA